MGGPRGRVGKVAVFQRSKSFDHLTAVSGVGSSPALATCETRQVLLAGVSRGTPVSPHLSDVCCQRSELEIRWLACEY